MYHHHPQQQGSQPFSNGPRPPHHQHQNRPGPGMMSQGMDFPFHRPTQLPDELESALAIRGARDMDHRLVEQMNRPTQLQNQSSGSGISQHGSFGSNSVPLTSDNQPGHQQGVDWSSYQPPTKLFASSQPGAGHQPQRLQGPQQQSKSSHAGTSVPKWSGPVSDSPARHPHGGGGGGGGGGDGQGLYTAESAGSILASFGLSNEDLEVLSHYPDDQLTPDTLPFILRDIQINKTSNQKTPPTAPTSSSSFPRTIPDLPLPPSRSSPMPRSRSPDVPSLLTVTQTAGKVIDYGHASRAKEESNTRETFKREQLSSERTVKMYPASSSSPSPAPRVDKVERRQVHLEHAESSKHGDRDYRRANDDHRKSQRSPPREFSPLSKSRNLDRDYRHDGPKPRLSPDARSEASSRRSLSSSSGSKLHSSSKKLPTPTMISDFSAAAPKVYPHTCSLCHIQCDQEKDWVDHINTVNHTAACRDLRNKYPDWKPNLPSRSGRYGSRALWDPKDGSPSRRTSRSVSGSLSPSPPHSRRRLEPHPHRTQGRPYSPHHHPRYHHYEGNSSRGTVKRPHSYSPKFSSDTSRHPSKAGYGSKQGLPQSLTKATKSGVKPGTKMAKTGNAKTMDTSAKPQPTKKKKKVVALTSQDTSFADRLVYLTGIPTDATEQEVTDLAGSFGKINNVILMPCSEGESGKEEGQKASVCMMKAEDAQALANSTDLSIREQPITASVAKKPEAEPSSEDSNSKPAAGEDAGEADSKTPIEKGHILITGLPESGWSESDIITLVQPFGTPSDITMATQVGKVLVSVPDMDIAEEMVKVNSFMPMKMGDNELKMTQVKQSISLGTPVALYNLLMGTADLLEYSGPVTWNSLLVIRNVPDTPTGSSEVQKLVRRFGTVIKTLVINSMVICEMATAAMALSVYKRFLTFPCIIHNNPLFFSRKPDPKPSTHNKVIPTYLDPPEDLSAAGTESKRIRAADKEENMQEDVSELPVEGLVQDWAQKTKTVSDSVASAVEPPAEANRALESDSKETPAVENMETIEEKEQDHGSKEEPDETLAGDETKPSDSLGGATLDLPKVAEKLAKTQPDGCQTTTSSHPSGDTPAETEQSRKPAEKKAEPKEEELKKQERDIKKEKEARERREKERKVRERKEREEKARKERERREEERREWEKKERARRERKRVYDDEPRSSRRMDGNRKSSWREEPKNRKRDEEKEEEFPFNMSDFVTVDEVGDVTDLPCSPSPTVAADPTQEDTSSSIPNDASKDQHAEPATPSESGDRDVPAADASKGLASIDPTVTVAPTSHSESDSTHVAPCEPDVPEPESTSAAAQESSTPETKAAADGASISASGAATSAAPDEVFDVASSKTPDGAPIKAGGAPDTASDAAPCKAPAGASREAAGPAPGGATTKADGAPSTAPVGTPHGASSQTFGTAPCGTPNSAPSQASNIASCGALNKAPEGTPNGVATKGPGTGPGGVPSKAASEACGPSSEPAAATNTGKENQHGQTEEEDRVLEKTEKAALDKEDRKSGAPALETVKKTSEEECLKGEIKPEIPNSPCSLPPYNPRNPVGLDLLVPKTGFFCKACNRFFCGAKEAEINHCKTFKHYENLQKYLQTETLESSA